MEIFRSLLALLAGASIGLAFGYIQEIALRRNEERQRRGELTSGWAVMPGSGRRIAGLVVTLAVVQVICPMFFVDGVRWFVSGGVVLGYSWSLFRKLFQKRSASL